MQGELAQLISLVSYGNAFLLHDYELNDFYPENTAFQFCNQVRFVAGSEGEQVEYAADPAAWLTKISKQGFRRLKLECHLYLQKDPPQHTMVAFAGGGSWWLSALADDHMDYWLGSWRVTDRDNPDRGIWGVTYHRVKENVLLSSPELVGLTEATEMLKSSLSDIAKFSEKHSEPGWTDIFMKAWDILTGDKPPSVVRMGNLVPNQFYSIEARRLLAGAAQAWVFGGMGSWNDTWFEDRSVIDEYEALTARLYNCVLAGLQEGVNSMVRP